MPRCIVSLEHRVIYSSSLEVKVGGTALLICAAKEHKKIALDTLNESGLLAQLIHSLVRMMKHAMKMKDLTDDKFEEVRGRTNQGGHFQERETVTEHDSASVLGGTVAMWLLSIIASFNSESKVAIMEAGAIEVLIQKLAIFSSSAHQIEAEDGGGTWVSALLFAILFQERDVIRSGAIICVIPSLAMLLRSDEMIDRYFAAQAWASLVCNGRRGTLLAVANSGAAGGLLPLLGSRESDISNLVELTEEKKNCT